MSINKYGYRQETNKRVTFHTLTYRSPDAIPGEYTNTDMAAGDTVFGDHKDLTARIPRLLESTEISALRMIRTEGTDEHLVSFFFKMAQERMAQEIKQKEDNTRRFKTFLF